MKKLFVLFIIFFLASTCFAAEYKANFKIDTGDTQLNLHLSNINALAATPTGREKVKIELEQNYSLSKREIDFLTKKGYTLAEIQYLALLAKESGKPINDIAALHSQGIGWGVLAKRLGVNPSALNKLIVHERKREKLMIHKEAVPPKPIIKVKIHDFPQKPLSPHPFGKPGRGPKR